MKRAEKNGNFFLCLLLNMLLNLLWTIPAWLLLGLHFWMEFSIWWFVGAMGLWLIYVLTITVMMDWAVRCGNEKDPPKENKNPYSGTTIKNYNEKE